MHACMALNRACSGTPASGPCTYIHIHMYVCVYIYAYAYMHALHTHTETYLYFTYHIHTPQALTYIYVYTFVYVCVSICNIIEYTRQGYIHACYMCMTMSSCMYMPLPCLWERHPRRATRAAPPCPPGPLHWPRVKPSAYRRYPVTVSYTHLTLPTILRV